MDEQQALTRLAALCSRAEHSSGEMLEKMRRWRLPDDAQERIIEHLRKERFVDDERFCRLFVRDKIRFDKWGRRKIEQALYRKGIGPDISIPVLDAIDTMEYVEALGPMIDAKRRTVKARNAYEMNAKLTKYALGRGFTIDVIRQCVDSADNCCFDDDDD